MVIQCNNTDFLYGSFLEKVKEFFLLLVIGLDLLIYTVPQAYTSYAEGILWTVTCGLIPLAVCGLPLCRKKEYGFVAAYWLWVMLTRVIHGSVTTDTHTIISVTQMCAGFVIVLSLKPQKQIRLIKDASFLFCIILMGWILLAIRMIFSGITFVPFTDKMIELVEEPQETGVLRALYLFSIHRNTSASWFMIGFFMLLQQFLLSRKPLWRFALAFGMAGMYVAMALQKCRTVFLATAFCVMVVACVLTFQKMKGSIIVKAIASASVGVCLGVLVLKGFSWCTLLVNEMVPVYRRFLCVLPASPVHMSAPTADMIWMSANQLAENNELFLDQRDFSHDFSTMTLRVSYWKAVWQSICKYPDILLWGQAKVGIIPRMQECSGLPWLHSHSHNTFTETLMLCGIPGLLLELCFLLQFAFNVIKALFYRRSKFTQMNAVIVIALVITGLMEPLFDSGTRLSSLMLMMYAASLVHTDEQNV